MYKGYTTAELNRLAIQPVPSFVLRAILKELSWRA